MSAILRLILFCLIVIICVSVSANRGNKGKGNTGRGVGRGRGRGYGVPRGRGRNVHGQPGHVHGKVHYKAARQPHMKISSKLRESYGRNKGGKFKTKIGFRGNTEHIREKYETKEEWVYYITIVEEEEKWNQEYSQKEEAIKMRIAKRAREQKLAKQEEIKMMESDEEYKKLKIQHEKKQKDSEEKVRIAREKYEKLVREYEAEKIQFYYEEQREVREYLSKKNIKYEMSSSGEIVVDADSSTAEEISKFEKVNELKTVEEVTVIEETETILVTEEEFTQIQEEQKAKGNVMVKKI